MFHVRGTVLKLTSKLAPFLDAYCFLIMFNYTVRGGVLSPGK
jgi:hypothetical protein